MTIEAPKIEVLLSTYNGERFLTPLLDSLWAQTIDDFRLRIRDDGSTDSTVSILRDLDEYEPRIDLVLGSNVGAAQSFLELLRSTDSSTNIVALCDQDDVWVPDKLKWGAEALCGRQGPTLYCGGMIITDDELRPLRAHRIPMRGLSFGNALVENVATGATIMLNRAAIDLAAKARPEHIVMHDQWLYLLMSGSGDVLYDRRPQVFYRQHGENTIGIAKGFGDWRHRATRHWRTGHERVLSRQAEELRRLHYEDLLPEARRQIDEFLNSRGSFSARLRYIAEGKTHRQRTLDDFVFKVLYLLGRV